MKQTRRGLLGAGSLCALSLLGGCLGEEMSGGFSVGDDNAQEQEEQAHVSDDEESTTDEPIDQLAAHGRERGMNILSIEMENETIVIVLQTSGDRNQDITTAAGVYATTVQALDADLRVRVEDRGLYQERFEIQHSWAEQFVAGAIDDQEYLDRIEETRRDQ